jgi:CRISPR-associated protein Csm3
MNKKLYKINVKVRTGLHIGVGSDKLQIGGVDNSFIKDPVSLRPYIPGSSMKGKLRSLLETEANEFNGEMDDTLNKYFGSTSEYLRHKNKDANDSPTRLIFRDIFLKDEFKGDYKDKYDNGQLQTEIKTEIKIDRKKGTAEGGALRTTERIPPDTEFIGELLVRYDNDKELEHIENTIKHSIALLNNDYLGGSGSRGYGAVEVKLI